MSGAFVLRAGRYRIAWLLALVAAVFGSATPAPAAPRITMSVVVPIVSATTSTGSLDAAELESNTAAGGGWAVLSAAALEHGATIALDSRITASIERLGDDAPASAVAWLAAVQRSNPLDLPWGNADPFALAATATNNRISAIQLSELSGVGASDIVGWPTGRVGDRNSVSRVHTLGFTALIVDDATFPGNRNALSATGGALLADGVSPRAALSAVDVVGRILGDGTVRAVSLPRSPGAIDPARASAVLDELASRGVSLTRYEPATTETLGNPVISKPHADVVATLLTQHRFDRRISAIGVNPAAIALPRLERICVLAGLADDDQFVALVRNYLRNARTYSDVVAVQQGAEYTILSNQADIPVTVSNLSTTDITVTLAARSQTGAMRVDSPDLEVTIAAGANEQVSIPVETVANGHTALVVTLTTAEGFDISGPIVLPVEIQAQWEGVTLAVFVGFVSIILSVGIVRQIRDRRRRA